MRCYGTSEILNTLAVFERNTNVVPLSLTRFPQFSVPTAFSHQPALPSFAEISKKLYG